MLLRGARRLHAVTARPLVAVDVDEVLCRYLRAYCRYASRAQGRSLRVRDFRSYNFWEATGETRDQMLEHIAAFHGSPEFLEGLEPVPGARDGLAALRGAGYGLCVVTSRQEARAAGGSS